MIDSLVALGIALLAGAVVPFAKGPALVALGASAWLARRRLRAWVLVAGFALAASAAWRAGRAVARFDARRIEARDAIGPPSRCEARAFVATSPAMIRGTLRWEGELDRVVCEGATVRVPLRARLYGGPPDLARGDETDVVATLGAVQLFRNEGMGDPRPSSARAGVVASGGVVDVRRITRGRGPPAWIDRARAHVRARILATFPAGVEPLARALVLGESDLDPADDEAFRTSGLAHLLAVSGTHLALAVAGAVAALAAVLRRIEALAARWDVGRIAAGVGVVLAWAYADFAGSSGSARRAAAMLSFALGARALGRRPNGVRAFGLSMVALAAAEPLVTFDLSFGLSLAATAGLLVLGPPLAQLVETRTRRLFHPPLRAASTTVAATIPCAPLIATIAPTLPAGGVLANVLAVPVGELAALPLCLGHAVLAWAPAAERGIALVASGSLVAVRAIARGSASIAWLAVPVPTPTPWQTALAAVTAVALACSRRKLGVACAAAALWLVSEIAAVRAGAPHRVLRVTSLDVGQGDSAIVDFPDGRAMLVDGGGLVGSPVDTGRAVVLPMLRARRRHRIDVAVLSHPHPDHFLGLASALPSLEVGELWDTGQGEAEGAGATYAALLDGLRVRGVPIVRPASLCGAPHRFGGAAVEVLAPCPGPVPLANANDNSFVLRIAFGRRAALLVGDAEHAEEASVLARAAGALHADLLKVGHHGSRTSSSPPFLAAVGATDAVVSCGVRNRFGHPHRAALDALAAAGLRVHRTDRGGSVVWETDGERVSVRRAASGD